MEWLGNGRTPWAAYQALMSGQLIALDRHPGFRPVGVGETWRSLMAEPHGKVRKAACGMEQLAGGLEAVIKGRIHDMRLLWAQNSQEE